MVLRAKRVKKGEKKEKVKRMLPILKRVLWFPSSKIIDFFRQSLRRNVGPDQKLTLILYHVLLASPK